MSVEHERRRGIVEDGSGSRHVPASRFSFRFEIRFREWLGSVGEVLLVTATNKYSL